MACNGQCPKRPPWQPLAARAVGDDMVVDKAPFTGVEWATTEYPSDIYTVSRGPFNARELHKFKL